MHSVILVLKINGDNF